MQRLGGQLRLVAGQHGAIVIGWDMTAALTMARALDIPPLAVAELLPPIEAVMVRKLNEEARAVTGSGGGASF